jgi:hypothetical protein
MDLNGNDPNVEELCKDAVQCWGYNAQVMMVIEEAAELILAVCKFGRGKNTSDHITDELADNRVMAKQLMMMVGITEQEVAARTNFKWNRLRTRLVDSKNKRAKARDVVTESHTVARKENENGKEVP